MTVIFKVYNWLGVGLVGLTGIATAILQPSTYAPSFLIFCHMALPGWPPSWIREPLCAG